MNKVLERIEFFARKSNRYARKWVKSFEKSVVLSLGENCLADSILSRNGLKSFSSPYASERSNIEYDLSFEKERFSDFLNPEYLRKEHFNSNTIVVRNKKYMDLSNKYHNTVINGFEFTHHDVLENQNAREALDRRCRRMLNLKKKHIVFLYHHRLCEQTDLELLISHLNQFAEIYRSRGNDVSIFLFMQKIVADANERCVKQDLINNIYLYTFYTLNEWAGNNQDIFRARYDDDLLSVMVEHIKRLL